MLLATFGMKTNLLAERLHIANTVYAEYFTDKIKSILAALILEDVVSDQGLNQHQHVDRVDYRI